MGDTQKTEEKEKKRKEEKRRSHRKEEEEEETLLKEEEKEESECDARTHTRTILFCPVLAGFCATQRRRKLTNNNSID